VAPPDTGHRVGSVKKLRRSDLFKFVFQVIRRAKASHGEHRENRECAKSSATRFQRPAIGVYLTLDANSQYSIRTHPSRENEA
jgi:hypothetical protein